MRRPNGQRVANLPFYLDQHPDTRIFARWHHHQPLTSGTTRELGGVLSGQGEGRSRCRRPPRVTSRSAYGPEKLNVLTQGRYMGFPGPHSSGQAASKKRYSRRETWHFQVNNGPFI